MKKDTLMRIFIIHCLLLLYHLGGYAQDFSRLQLQLDSTIREKKITGAQVCVINNDSILWEGYFGFADLADSVPVSPETMFRIGSTSKSFTGIAIMQLLENGLLSLEDPISKYISDVEWKNQWEATDPVRIVHLLEHTTGFDDMHLREYAANADGWTLKQGLDFAPRSRRSRWKPGMHSSYCNSGPPMAAYIVEKITGQSIESYVDNEIFEPLGMSHSSFLKTPHVDSFLAKGYAFDPPEEQPYWHIIQRPAGAINSNVREMAQYLRIFLNLGRVDSVYFLSSLSMDRMERPESTLAAKEGCTDGYAKYLYTRNFNGIQWIGHDGGMMGFLCTMHYNRQLNRGYIILINSGGDIGSLEKIILTSLEEGQDSIVNAIATGKDLDSLYFGAYTSATSRNQITRFVDRLGSLVRISVNEDTLRYTSGLFGTMQTIYNSDGHLYVVSENGERDPITFATHEGIRYMQGPGNFKETKVWKVWGEIIILVLFGLMAFIGIAIGLIAIGLRLFRRSIPHDRYLLWPSVAGLSIIGLLLGLQMGSIDPFKSLAAPTIWSVLILISSVVLSLASLMCGVSVFKWRNDSSPKWLKVCLVIFAIAAITISIYLIRHGVVGLRTWAY